MSEQIDKYDKCPECNESWDGGRIWKVWREMDSYKDKTDEELQKMEKESYSEPYHFSKLVGIKDRDKYDGVSYWHCPFCKATWDRFTNKLIGKKDYAYENKKRTSSEGSVEGTEGNVLGYTRDEEGHGQLLS